MDSMSSSGVFAAPSPVSSSAPGTVAETSTAATSSAAKRQFDSWQSLRLFASVGVLQYHLWQNYLQVNIGHPGTDFFLVLVGTVAALTQARRIPEGKWRRYFLSRMVRLYVVYAPLFLMTIGVKWNEATWDWMWRSFLFVPIADRLPVIGATWMLIAFRAFLPGHDPGDSRPPRGFPSSSLYSLVGRDHRLYLVGLEPGHALNIRQDCSLLNGT